MASATALWQKMAGTKPRGGEMGMDGGADRCGWSREKEERDLGRVWNNKEGTDSRPHRPLREVAFSWEKSCWCDLSRGSDQIRFVFWRETIQASQLLLLHWLTQGTAQWFWLFPNSNSLPLSGWWGGGGLGTVLPEMLVKLSTQVEMAGRRLLGTGAGTVGFPFCALSQLSGICSKRLQEAKV